MAALNFIPTSGTPLPNEGDNLTKNLTFSEFVSKGSLPGQAPINKDSNFVTGEFPRPIPVTNQSAGAANRITSQVRVLPLPDGLHHEYDAGHFMFLLAPKEAKVNGRYAVVTLPILNYLLEQAALLKEERNSRARATNLGVAALPPVGVDGLVPMVENPSELEDAVASRKRRLGTKHVSEIMNHVPLTIEEFRKNVIIYGVSWAMLNYGPMASSRYSPSNDVGPGSSDGLHMTVVHRGAIENLPNLWHGSKIGSRVGFAVKMVSSAYHNVIDPRGRELRSVPTRIQFLQVIPQMVGGPPVILPAERTPTDSFSPGSYVLTRGIEEIDDTATMPVHNSNTSRMNTDPYPEDLDFIQKDKMMRLRYVKQIHLDNGGRIRYATFESKDFPKIFGAKPAHDPAKAEDEKTDYIMFDSYEHGLFLNVGVITNTNQQTPPSLMTQNAQRSHEAYKNLKGFATVTVALECNNAEWT